KPVFCRRGRRLKVLKIDADRHHPHFLGRDTQIARHEFGVEFADRKKEIDMLDVRANKIERLVTIWLLQAIEKKILSLKRATNGTIQFALQRSGQAKQ